DHAHRDGRVFGAIAQCVDEQVLDRLRHAVPIVFAARLAFAMGADFSARMRRLGLVDHLRDEVHQTTMFAFDVDASTQARLREIQQIADHSNRAIARGLDALQHPGEALVEVLLLERGGGREQDHVQRVAEVVAHDADELLLELGAALGLRFGFLLLGDVGDEALDELERAVLVVNADRALPHALLLTAVRADPVGDRELLPGGEGSVGVEGHALDVVGVHQGRPRGAAAGVELLWAIARELFGAGARVLEHPWRSWGAAERHARHVAHQRLQRALGFETGFLGALAFGLLVRFPEGSLDARSEAFEAILEHVVGRAALEQFDRTLLSEGARDEHERGLGARRAGLRERLRAVETGDVVIGEDEVESTIEERPGEGGLRIHADDVGLEPRLDEVCLDELGVQLVVLEEQHGESLACAWVVHSAPLARVPGGGSFTTVQNMPSSLSVATNSPYSTGLTTYALTPRP